MEILINALYIYVAVFSIYFLILSVRNLNTNKSKIDEVLAYNIRKKQLCVVIYAHNQLKDLEKILNQLRRQDYAINNFQTYVILDNCTDGSQDFVSLKSSVNVLELNEGGLIGKDASYSILLEKLITNENIDAYVFLDVDKYINIDFLTSINYALSKNDVITGSVVYQNHKQNLVNKIKRVYSIYMDHFLRNSRSMLGLANSINSKILIIKKDLVDAIGSIDLKNVEAELKYSLLLSKIKKQCYFNPNIRCYSTSSDIEIERPTLFSRLILFKNCFSTTKTLNFKYVEYVYSLLNPNCLFAILAYAFIISFSLKYYFFVSSEVVLVTCLCLVAGFFLSLVRADLRGKDYLYLMLYPAYTLGKIILSFPIISFFAKIILSKKSDKQKYVVNVEATLKKRKLPCKLELIVENDMSKVVFRYKNKKFTTSKHLRMNEAIKELVDKLRDYNFTINICQCCKFFTPYSDGTQNMIQGTCHYEFAGIDKNVQLNVLLWNSCGAHVPNQVHSLIEKIANN